MTTTTATLTEFLLARIAEDETAAQAWVMVGSAPKDSGGHSCDGLEAARDVITDAQRRVLAECEAKRKQIDHLIEFMEGDYAPWNETQLEIMAAVYADHPDYREDWRP